MHYSHNFMSLIIIILFRARISSQKDTNRNGFVDNLPEYILDTLACLVGF